MSIYKERANVYKNKAREVKLAILIFGPGEPDPNAKEDERKPYTKRCEMKETLRSSFEDSEIHFPEDEEMKELSCFRPDQYDKEAFQIASVHLLINLKLDPKSGAESEFQVFSRKYKWVIPKSRILMPIEILNEIKEKKPMVYDIYKAYDENHIIGFTQKQYDDCMVSHEITFNIVLDFALGCLFDLSPNILYL